MVKFCGKAQHVPVVTHRLQLVSHMVDVCQGGEDSQLRWDGTCSEQVDPKLVRER